MKKVNRSKQRIVIPLLKLNLLQHHLQKFVNTLSAKMKEAGCWKLDS
ncbi:MAG: hypothetical protein JWQ40_2439 [Segetibacter sp.]|nr:hypothetical protein [Segetibacter sp.]